MVCGGDCDEVCGFVEVSDCVGACVYINVYICTHAHASNYSVHEYPGCIAVGWVLLLYITG